MAGEQVWELVMSDEGIPLRISEVCRRSSLSDWQVRQAIARGDLRAKQIGKSWLVDPRSLARLLSFEPPSSDGEAA